MRILNVMLILWALGPLSAAAQELEIATDATLDSFLWQKRPLVIFADSANDPRFVQQLDALKARPEPLLERDVVILIDTDPAAAGPLRTALRPRGFMIALIGKDGRVTLRKPTPWDVREISRAIDKIPLRQQELTNS